MRISDWSSDVCSSDLTVLRHVDKAAGQITRVRRLERRVGQALAGAVGRVEIFKDGQAFLEVRDDRRFDDLARRLGHQAAHAGELLHLRRRTTRARMRHHVRTEERRGGKESVSTGRSRGAPYHIKKK